MTRMRHPAEDVAGEIDVPEEAVGMHRMSGWLTDEEWTRAGLPEPPEPEPEDDTEATEADEESGGESSDEADPADDNDPDGESGEQKTKRSRRSRSRATSEKEND